jgi:L-threonylcarbamoyladenylate synthase
MDPIIETKKIKTTKGWEDVARVLKNGGIAIIPSESAYGIAALISNHQAIKRLYQIKKRADDKPSLIIIGSIDQAKELVNFSSKALVLANKFWPGGLTIVLDSKKKDLPQVIYGEEQSLAIRLPNDENLRNLALEVGPFILPSANFNNEKPPFKKEEIDSKLASMVDFVLNEETGGNQVSTLVDARGEDLVVLRQGAVSI